MAQFPLESLKRNNGCVFLWRNKCAATYLCNFNVQVIRYETLSIISNRELKEPASTQ